VDEFLKTSNKDVYAVGDCIAARFSNKTSEKKANPGKGPQFTHNSDAQARQVIRNALFLGSEKRQTVNIPRVTYTHPEVAHTGKTRAELDQAKIPFDTYNKQFAKGDRALCDSVEGYMNIYCKKGTDTVLGATFVGGPAGDMISIVSVGIKNGLGLAKLGECIYPYPTYAEGIRNMADAFNKTKLTGTTKSFLRTLMGIKR